MKWVSIGSGNGLLPVWHQAITWTKADLFSIGHLGTNFSGIRIKIQNFSFMKMHLKMPSVKWRPFCPGGDELTLKHSGPRFNMKMTSYQYRKSHCGDKTILRPSYLHNGISYTGKMTSLYWISPQVAEIFMDDRNTFILHCHFARSQGISSNNSDLFLLNIPVSTSEALKV